MLCRDDNDVFDASGQEQDQLILISQCQRIWMGNLTYVLIGVPSQLDLFMQTLWLIFTTAKQEYVFSMIQMIGHVILIWITPMI